MAKLTYEEKIKVFTEKAERYKRLSEVAYNDDRYDDGDHYLNLHFTYLERLDDLKSRPVK